MKRLPRNFSGSTFRALRRLYGISQIQLGEYMGRHRSRIIGWEKGIPPRWAWRELDILIGHIQQMGADEVWNAIRAVDGRTSKGVKQP